MAEGPSDQESRAESSGELPLEGVRILGVSRVLAGPYLGQLLGDFGAEVIHVERPVVGDDSRHIPPFSNGHSLVYMICNRSKKSITLNLKDPRGVTMFKDLVAVSDVVIENNRPGVMDRLGIGWDSLREVNPALVMTSISGFGQTGPYSELASYNQIAQAAGGMMSLTGTPDGPPLRTAAVVADNLATLYAGLGTMIALHHRDRSGQGQHVDASLFDGVVATLGPALQEYLTLGTVRERTGNWGPTMAPSNVYPCRDGYMMIVAGNDHHWRKLCATLERGDLASDSRFATGEARVANVEQVDAIVTAWSEVRSATTVARTLQDKGIPCSRVNGPDMVADDPHVRERGLIAEMTDPNLGTVKTLGVIPQLSETPGRIVAPPPLLGQHNSEIYGAFLGLGDNELEALQEAGVI